MRFKYIFILLVVGCLHSCNDEFLQEEPVDFIAAENAFVTYDDFSLSINNLYNKVRKEFYSKDQNYPLDYLYGTDLVYDGQASERRWDPIYKCYAPIWWSEKSTSSLAGLI